jgi:hypothetical protein
MRERERERERMSTSQLHKQFIDYERERGGETGEKERGRERMRGSE